MTLPANFRTNWRVPFPSLVVGLGAIAVTKQNGLWTIGLSTAVLSQLAGGGARTTTFVTTSSYNASSVDQDIFVNYNGAVAIAMPPASGRNGINLIVHDFGGFAASHNITCTATGTDVFEDGGTSFPLSIAFQTREFKPVQTGAIWTWAVLR